VLCGAQSCDTPSQYCCVSRNTDGSTTPACRADGTTCDNPAIEMHCDEAGDCAEGQICCSALGAGGAPLLTCAPSCGMFGVQVCRTSAECRNGKPCVVQTCMGHTVETCGPLPPQAGCT
jgi:hypothetical protein